MKNSQNLILQASLVKKLGGIITIVSILKEIESLKFLLRSVYIFCSRPLKLSLYEKNRIFSVRAYDQHTFTILYVLNAVVSYLNSLQSPPTKFPVTKTTSFVPPPRHLKFLKVRLK